MNEGSNLPVSAGGSPGMAGWLSTWVSAVTKPNEQTYAVLAAHPDAASNSRAFMWVFIAGTVAALINGVLSAILTLAGFGADAGIASFFGGDANRGIAFTFGVTICSSPVAGAIGALAFAIFTGIVQWVARLFKGTGSFSQLAYTLAAIAVPFTFISSFLSPFSVVPYVGYCVSAISFLLGLYALVLEIMAVKGVNKFGWGEAAGSVLLPSLLVICCAVVFGVAMGALGVAIGETFNEINQNLP